MSSRTVAIWEAPSDQIALMQSNFQFQFAKSVIGTDGQLAFNMVWQSKALAPRMTVSWAPVYGLNWTLQIPQPGISVTVGGTWQQVDPGSVVDLSAEGFWTQSSATPQPGFMKVGTNNYNYPGANGIHIVVGVNTGNGFQAIYVDPVVLATGMSSWYQPQEKVQYWYQTGSRSQTMIAGAGTTKNTYDMSAPDPTTGNYYVSSTYLYQSGRWINSPNPPPSMMATGVMRPSKALITNGTNGFNSFNEYFESQDDSNALLGGPAEKLFKIVFNPPIENAIRTALTAYTMAKLSETYKNVTAAINNAGVTMSVTMAPKDKNGPNGNTMLTLNGDTPEENDINIAMLSAKKDGKLPNAEVWSIST